MNIKDLKRFLEWRIKTSACDTKQACALLGIKPPSLIAMRERGDITGRQWDGKWWYPMSEVEKNVIAPGEVKNGRPRSGSIRSAV